jgi:hypothetical protein
MMDITADTGTSPVVLSMIDLTNFSLGPVADAPADPQDPAVDPGEPLNPA